MPNLILVRKVGFNRDFLNKVMTWFITLFNSLKIKVAMKNLFT